MTPAESRDKALHELISEMIDSLEKVGIMQAAFGRRLAAIEAHLGLDNDGPMIVRDTTVDAKNISPGDVILPR